MGTPRYPSRRGAAGLRHQATSRWERAVLLLALLLAMVLLAAPLRSDVVVGRILSPEPCDCADDGEADTSRRVEKEKPVKTGLVFAGNFWFIAPDEQDKGKQKVYYTPNGNARPAEMPGGPWSFAKGLQQYGVHLWITLKKELVRLNEEIDPRPVLRIRDIEDIPGASIKHVALSHDRAWVLTDQGLVEAQVPAGCPTISDCDRLSVVRVYQNIPTPEGIAVSRSGALWYWDSFNTIAADQREEQRPDLFAQCLLKTQCGIEENGRHWERLGNLLSQWSPIQGLKPVDDYVFVLREFRPKGGGPDNPGDLATFYEREHGLVDESTRPVEGVVKIAEGHYAGTTGQYLVTITPQANSVAIKTAPFTRAAAKFAEHPYKYYPGAPLRVATSARNDLWVLASGARIYRLNQQWEELDRHPNLSPELRGIRGFAVGDKSVWFWTKSRLFQLLLD